MRRAHKEMRDAHLLGPLKVVATKQKPHFAGQSPLSKTTAITTPPLPKRLGRLFADSSRPPPQTTAAWAAPKLPKLPAPALGSGPVLERTKIWNVNLASPSDPNKKWLVTTKNHGWSLTH